MAKHLVNKKDIAKVVQKTDRQVARILHKEISPSTKKPFVFSIVEAVLILNFFKGKGEDSLTLDELFYNEVSSI
jgi:hypothetical protein